MFRLRLGICMHLFAVMVGPGNLFLYVHTCVCNILCRIVSAYRIYIYTYMHHSMYPASPRRRSRCPAGRGGSGRARSGPVYVGLVVLFVGYLHYLCYSIFLCLCYIMARRGPWNSDDQTMRRIVRSRCASDPPF